MKHGIVRLDNVWGVGGGLRPVKVLSKKVIGFVQDAVLLEKYLGLFCSSCSKFSQVHLRRNVSRLHCTLRYLSNSKIS